MLLQYKLKKLEDANLNFVQVIGKERKKIRRSRETRKITQILNPNITKGENNAKGKYK